MPFFFDYRLYPYPLLFTYRTSYNSVIRWHAASIEDPAYISQLTAGYWQNGWLVGWLVVRRVCLSRVSLSALGLAISPERVVRSTSFLACGRGPPGPRMYAVTPGEACQRRVYNAIRVDSVPSCKLGPARTRPRVETRLLLEVLRYAGTVTAQAEAYSTQHLVSS